MDVRLPDGTLITDIPDGTTKAQLDAKLALIGYDTAVLTSAAQNNNYETSTPPEPEPEPAPIESLTQPEPIESLTQPVPKDLLAQPAPKDMLAEPEEPRNIVFEVFAQVAAGAVVAIPEMIGKAADWINPGSGTDLREWAEEVEDNNPWLAQQTEGRTAVGKAFSDGARMLAPSITSVATAGVAVVLAPLLGAGAALTAAIGTGVTALTIVGLFGASQAEDTYEKLLADGVPEEDARKAAWMTGIIEAGGEGIANRFTFGLLKGVTGPLLKETAEIILRRSTSTAIIAPFAKNTLLNAAGEVVTEFGQGASQTAIENIYGAKDPQSPWSVGAEGGASALAMSVLLAPFGLRANFKRSEANAALENENAPENERYRAAVRVHAALTEFDVEQDAALKATLKDISSDNSMSDGQKKVALQEARSNARKDAGDAWASNVWARNAGLAIQQKLAVDLSPEQLTTPAEPNAPEPDLPLDKAAFFSENRARSAAIEAKLAAAAKPTPAEREVAPSAAEIEAALTKKKADVLNGSQGTAPIVKRVGDVNETIEDFAAAVNLAAGTVSNPVTVLDRIAEGYKEVPSGSEYRTRLTKTNDDNTVNTIEVGPNGAVESDLTVLGNFTVNDAPVSVRWNKIDSRLERVEEDDSFTELPVEAYRRFLAEDPLLDILQAEDPSATIAPVALGETPASSPQPREFVASDVLQSEDPGAVVALGETVAPAETPAAFAPPKEFELAGDTELAARVLDTAETKVAEIPAEFQPAFMSAVNEFLGLAPFTTAREMDKESPEWNAAYVAGWTHAGEQRPATETALPQNILDLAEKQFIAQQNLIDNKDNTPEGRVPAKYSTAATLAFRRLNTALKEIEPNEEKRLVILRDLSAKNDARVAALRAAPATEAAAPATQTAALQPINLEARIADLNVRADTQGRRTLAGRILGLTAAHLRAPTKESQVKLELALKGKTAKAGTNVQVAEAVDAAKAALAPAPTEQTAQLAEGDSVRVGNVPGVVVAVEAGYIKFHPINATNPKAYQRVPAATVTFISRPDVSATSAKSEKVGLSVDLAQMAERFGADMYGSSLMEVVVKEGLQNSFDAVKGRLFLEMAAKKKGVADLSDAAQIALFEAYLLANPKIFGHVKITLNSEDRTVTFSDDGVGMSPDIVKNAFLTIAASNKAGLPAGLASGGLGLAKMGILMGAARIQLTTVKGGVQTSIDTTKTELLNKATIFNVNKTKEPSGTTLTLTIPETFTAKNGDEVGIYFKDNPDNVTPLQRPLVGPVEVEVTSIDRSGTRTKVIATGVNFDTSGYQNVRTADTDWGRINIYFGVERKKYPKHVVLSSGVYQFDYDIRDASYEKIPFDIVLNIQPKDKASERDYPFENNRERFKPRVGEDLDALQAYLLAIARGESAKDLKEGFKDVVSMPRIEVGAALADNSKKLRKAFDTRNSGEVKELAPLPDEVTITSGTVIDTRGAVIAQSDAAAKAAEKKTAATFVEKEAAPDIKAFMSDTKADPLQPVFLNNTSVDYRAVGRPYGNPEAFFAELGTLMVEMKEELSKSKLKGYDALSAENLFFGGIAIDRKYGGIHIKVPFNAVFVNPFYDWGAKTLFGVTENLYETMTHEIAHVRDMSHGVGHNTEMIRVRQHLADGATAQYFRDAILDLLIRHESTFTAMRTAYGLSTTKNTGKPLDEYTGNSPSASARGSATRVQGELGPVRAGEGLGRGVDLQAAGSPGEQGEVGGGAGRVAAVDDTRFSVKSDKMGATGTAKAWVEFAEVKKLIDFGVVKTLAQAKAAAEADYTKTFDALPAFDAKAYLEGVIAVEGPLLPQNIQDAIQAYKNGDEGGAVGTLLADVKRAREGNIARWKNYFDNVNTEQGSDPFWKSYVAHGVVNTFDATKPNTGETFNAAALATVYGKFLEGTAPNFTKAYRAAKMAATADLVELGDARNGWRKVPQTAKSDPNFAERVAEVQAISSESWCTKTYNAAPYIEKGDFWVYVDKGRPELAIRFEGSDVAEIQGRANNGSIPSQYAGEVQALVDSGKIQNLSPRTKKALQDATDRSLALKRLESEATFVEEIDSGGASIRVYEKANGDLVFLTEGGWPSLPAQYANRVVEVIGNLNLPRDVQANNLTTVSGDLQVDVGAQVNNLTTVGGRVVLHRDVQANSLTTVAGGLYLHENAQANNLTTVGGNLTLDEGAQANSVTTVGGSLELYKRAQVNSLTTVSGSLVLNRGAQANSVTTVGGILTLNEGAQANSVTTAGSNLILSNGAQANSVTTVGGNLELSQGTQVNNLTTVGGYLILYEGAQANNVTTVGGSLDLHEGAQANSVTTVGGNFIQYESAQANNLTTVGGNLTLRRGAQANSLTTVGGNLTLNEGAQANSVTTVGGSLELYKRAQALSLQAVGVFSGGNTPENTPNLKYIGDKDAVERIKAQTAKSLIGTALGGSMTVVEVEAAVISALDKLQIGTEIYGTVEEARAETGVDIPVGAKGMYAQGKIHLFAENIANAVDAQITAWHEILHAGLDRLYKSGSKKYNAALVTIAARNPRVREEAEKWTKSFGADVEAEAIRLGATAERAAQYTRMRAIDEALAIMSSENVTIRGLDKFIAVVQNIIRQIGLTQLADAMEGKTNAEALALISKARGALLAGGSYVVTDSAPAFLRGASLQNRPLRLTGTGPNGRVLNWDLGQAFTRAHRAQYGRVFNVDRPADRAEMIKSLNAEYRSQTRQPDNGEEWYVEDVARALKITRAILPELRVPSNRDLFLTMAALTSPQQKPNQNWQNAIHAMRGYIKTGRIALVKPNGTQFGVPSQTSSLQLLQHLIDTKGLAKALRWLNASHSGQEIAEVRRDSGLYETKATLSGYVASETNLTDVYLGIEMFGPKVSEFMLNATGIDPNAVTVDLWLARTYNRLLGRLTDVSPQKRKDQIIQSDLRSPTERNSIKSLIRDVAAQNGISPSAMQAALWYFEQRLYRSHGLNAPSQNFSGAASLAVGNERSRSSGNVQRAGRNEVPAVSGRGKTKKVVESLPYNAVQTTVRLNKLEDETDPVALKNGVVALARDLRVQAANRPVRERSRGYDWIQERLLRAVRLGEMDREQVRLGMWLLNNNPNLADDLGISLRTARSNDASGNYNPMSRIMTLFKERGQETLIAHEILHHAERMMPEDIQAGIRAEWLSQITGMLDAAIRTNDTVMVEHLRDVLRAAAGNTTAYNRVADGIRNGTLSQDFYQYINPSEFWAVNAADIVAARASESWVQRAVQWLREFKAKIQELFNFPSNAAVIRGLDNVLNAANEGERQSPYMLADANTYNAMGNRTEPTLPVPSTFTERELDKNTYRFVDRFIDLKNLMKTIKSLAPALPERLEVYGMVERLTARVAKQVKDFGNREIDPLIKDMLARGVSVAELDNYLWMRAAPDANRIIAQQPDTKFPNLDGAGVSTADAQAYLAALTPKQRTAFEALAKRVDAITAKTRREWVRYGMATLDDVNKMEREQPYYVPFNREGKDIGAGTGQGVSVRGPNTFHRRGSDRPVVDVLANIIHQRDRAVVRGEKNLISRAIYALAKTFPDAKMWSLASPGITSAIDAETGEPVSILDMSYQKDPNVLMSIRLDKNGKMVAQGVAFNEDNEQAMRMVGALKNLDLPSLEGVYASVAPITRYFAALNTQYNPIFGLINLARDVSSGMLNLSTTAIAGKQFQVAELIAPALASIYAITRAERRGLPPGTGKYSVYFERFQNAGGSTGWRDSFATSADRGKALQKELDSLSYGTAKKILPAIGGWLSDYNTAMEGSTRLAAFIVAVESGLSDAQAASIAKNLTVNFDRKGAVSSQLGALYAFFNPAVQGTVRTLETLRGPTGKKIIAGGLLLGALQAVALAMAGFDDDDPPEFVRQRNVIIPIGDKKYVSFPMPLGFNILPNIGRLAMQTALRPANIGKNVLSAMEAVLSTFNPFGAGLTLQTFAPTVADPFVAIGTNKDWTGKPIERKDFSSLDPTPGYTRAKDNASWISTIIAQGINTLTFGDKYTPGMVSPTPDLIDYIGGQLTGGPGRELLNLETALEGWFSGKEVPTYKIPVAGRFYGNTGTEAGDKARFYENVQTLNVLENNVRERQRDRVSSAAFRRDNPETRLIPMVNIIKRQITQFRSQKENPGNDDARTDALILRQMQRLNELAAPYKAPTAQQKFLRNLVTE